MGRERIPNTKNCTKRNERNDLTILDAYNQVLDLPSKDDHHHTTMSIPLSEKNKENILPNQVSTVIRQIVITPPEPDKTEQEVVLKKTTQTKASGDVIPQTNEIESKHNATSQGAIALMEMDDMSRKTKDMKERALPKSPRKKKSTTARKKTIDKCNNTNMVTLEMHKNLKNTINKIVDEIAQFAKGYEEEEEEEANIAPNFALIAPVTSENIQLKEELNDANLKIEQLRSQILDITTQNK